MSNMSSIVSGPAKLWAYPVIGLCIVGAPALAASWSGAFTTGLGTGMGIVVHDAPNIAESFKQGESEAEKKNPATVAKPAPNAAS